MTFKKLAQLKAFLRKEGGGAGGDGGGDGGGFAGTAFTVESSGFTPTYGGGGRKKKKDSKSVKKENSSTRFAEELLKYAIDKSIELNKGVIGHKDMRNTDLKQTSPSGDNIGYTRHADIGRKTQYRVVSPPEIPFQHDAVLNWEDVFQKNLEEELTITSKVLIRDSENKVLILKDRGSDWWDLPGGHIHDDETPEEGLLREVKEETGMSLNEANLVLGREVKTAIGDKLGLFFVSYIPIEAPRPLLSDEHTDYAWIKMEDTYYFNLGVWAPIIRYILRFMFEGDHGEDNPYVEAQSAALARLDKALVVHAADNGDKTALASDGVYLVKSKGQVFKQQPWPASEEDGDLLNIEEDDFLKKVTELPTEFYKPLIQEHAKIIDRPLAVLRKPAEAYDVLTPPDPSSPEVLHELEQIQSIQRQSSDKDKARLTEIVNKSDKTFLRVFFEYGRDHGLNVDRYEKALEAILEDVNTVVMDKKYSFNFPRPWQYQMGEPIIMTSAIRPSIDSPSYPSGHSAQAFVVSTVLGNVFPNHREDFEEIAESIGVNRVKAGWHFPLDHVAGKKLGLAIANDLPSAMGLEKDRVYLNPGQEAPEGVKVETGPMGGKFYDEEVQGTEVELEGSDRGESLGDGDWQRAQELANQPDVEGREAGRTEDFKNALNAPYEARLEAIFNAMGASVDEPKVAERLSGNEGDPYDSFTGPQDENYLVPWLSGSLEGDAIGLQYAAADLFSSSRDRLDKVSEHFTSPRDEFGNPKDYTQDHLVAEAKEYLGELYANTQNLLEKRGVETIKLYRGVDTRGQKAVKAGQRVATKDLPLSSWTSDPSTGMGFGDTVVSRTFHAGDIIASCLDKLPMGEFEFMVHTPDVGFEGTVENVDNKPENVSPYNYQP